MLNFDFRLAPSLLHAVAKLHTGALVYSQRETALLLTCEAYSRSKATDVHSETSMKSFPKDGESIFVGICEESDGGGAKQKLKIGGKHMNVLSTMSVIIGHELLVNIGPETKMADANYTIFYPEENVKVYKAAMEQATNYTATPDVNAIRQLVSGFGDPSTYKPYRASLEKIGNHETMMPVTVFNLCDLPHNGNYGVSDTAAPKIASRFLNAIATAYLLNKYTVPKEQFKEMLQFFNANKTQKSQQWRVLCTFVDALEAELQKSQKIDILSFGRAHVTPLAAMINQVLSAANTQIKVNVAKQLTTVYGNQNK
ncbi:hypothetical protein BJV82DRAFT_508760 [Fennellomyces sp. T-0311]|nr:hypothetical protein BJV82DRAFT_508760 [Fennellomyces sp. T-0311]